MAQKRKKQKMPPKKRNLFSSLAQKAQSNKRLVILLAIMLFGLAGSYILFNAKAQRYTDASAVYGADSNFTNAGPTPPATAGQDMNFTVVANPPATWIWGGSYPAQAHINLEFYHDGPVTYKEAGFVCGSAGTCTGAPAFPGNGPSFQADARKCVNLTSASIRAAQITLMTVRYTMGTGSSVIYPNKEGSFEVRAHADWEPGLCGNANDWQNCYFVSRATCPGTGWPIAAYGGGRDIGGCQTNCEGEENDDGDEEGGDDDGDTGDEGDGQNQNTNRGTGGGGGGSSATRRANQPNTTPDSSSQGQNEQPNLEPSPFFDGKEFAPGSESDSSVAGIAKTTGQKLVRYWYVTAGTALLGGAAGWFYWQRRH